jgi:hypothetical protein
MTPREEMIWIVAFVAALRDNYGKDSVPMIRAAVFHAGDAVDAFRAVQEDPEFTDDMDDDCRAMALTGPRPSPCWCGDEPSKLCPIHGEPQDP